MLPYIRDQILELVGAGQRKLAGSSVMIYRTWSLQSSTEGQTNTALVCLIGSGM